MCLLRNHNPSFVLRTLLKASITLPLSFSAGTMKWSIDLYSYIYTGNILSNRQFRHAHISLLRIMPCSRLASFSIPGIRLYASLSSSDRKSHYDILGLSPTSTALQIKQKYFELAKLYHPDRNRNKSAGQKQEAIKSIPG